MKADYRYFNFLGGVDRIDEILESSDNSYEEVDEVPARDRLTFTNGYYVNCTCLFVDIRGSSKLPDAYTRPTLARIYRSYLSEVVAALSGNTNISEINIHGDAVWGVFNTTTKAAIDTTFATAATVASTIDVLNCRLRKKKQIDPIAVGIGVDYGRALMVKAGYKGSGINDVVWMGDVVNSASNLCGQAGRGFMSYRIVLSDVIYQNLNEDNQKLLTQKDYNTWHGNVVNTAMDDWIDENCKEPERRYW